MAGHGYLGIYILRIIKYVERLVVLIKIELKEERLKITLEELEVLSEELDDKDLEEEEFEEELV